MDIKQLRAFLAIADTGSVTRASEALHIVQPALSRQLRMLEEDIGTPLFERGPRGMELTDAGTWLIERARRALREIDHARTDILAAQPRAVKGIVEVGLLNSQSELISGPLVSRLRARHPELVLRIFSSYSDRLREWLESGEVGVAALTDYRMAAQLDMQPLFSENLWVIGPAGAPMPLDSPVGLQRLVQLPLILPVFQRGLRPILDHASQAQNCKLTVVAESNDTRVQKALVAAGLGYAVLPLSTVTPELARNELQAVPIARDELNRRTGIAVSMLRRNSLAVRTVAQEMSAVAKEMILDGRWPGATWLHDGES